MVYTVLLVGSVTTVYPFLMMLGSSFSSLNEFYEYRLVPRFLYQQKALHIRYVYERHRQEYFDILKFKYHVEEPLVFESDGEKINRWYGRASELEGMLEEYDVESAPVKARIDDWLTFVDGLAMTHKEAQFRYPGRIYLGEVEVGWQKFLKEKYTDVGGVNKAHSTVFKQLIQVDPPYEAPRRHEWFPVMDRKMNDWLAYTEALPPRVFDVIMVRHLWELFLRNSYNEVGGLNAAWESDYEYFWQIPFPYGRPEGAEGDDWERFIRKRLPLRFVRLDVAAAHPAWVEFLSQRFREVKSYNVATGDKAGSFQEARLDEYPPADSLAFGTWHDFYRQAAPTGAVAVESADRLYESYLAEEYGDIEGVNEAYGTQFAALADAEPPWRELDYWDFTTRKNELRKEYGLRNYRYVIKAIFLQGRPLFNTFLLVTLTVGAAVTVNPLAAYALSRYQLSYGPKVLIFLLATMSFPAQVTMIPNFLMIRDLGLLNTFAALILPMMAKGYSVFLLKGFFDSLPQELYEAASIDGASELRMFWMITMPLSLPILSVIGLYAFGFAYGSFIWAFTVCQDRKMWTLMVFLQQFQTEMKLHPYLVMSSLVLAAIPTVIVFLSAQKVLMKGIVVPTMK